MREKRFECVFVENKFGGTSRRLKDNETNITYMTCDVADLLNEQQDTISRLEEENEMLRILLKDIYVDDELRKLAERYGVENE